MNGTRTIGQYLIDQLADHGVRHVFGIPGDYVLGFYDSCRKANCASSIPATSKAPGSPPTPTRGCAGLGAVCITYCVGGLKVANSVAGAFAEKSPVVVISGAPGMKERQRDPLLHHKVRDFDTQRKVFDKLTVASAVLSDPQTAFQEIDRVLHAALRYKRPVYLELPRDIVAVPGNPQHRPPALGERSDPRSLRGAGGGRRRHDQRARKPVIVADVEVHRFGLQNELIELAEKTRHSGRRRRFWANR